MDDCVSVGALDGRLPMALDVRAHAKTNRAHPTLLPQVLSRCRFEDVFTDSKFLRQESLVRASCLGMQRV